MSSKGSGESQPMHSNSDNMEYKTGNNIKEIINELFSSHL